MLVACLVLGLDGKDIVNKFLSLHNITEEEVGRQGGLGGWSPHFWRSKRLSYWNLSRPVANHK